MRRLHLLLLLSVLAACGSDPGTSAREPTRDELPAGDFVIASLPEPFGPGDRGRVSFRDDGHVSFSATCNTMSGTARVAGGVLEVGQVGGTEMGCPGAGHGQDEWLVGFFTSRPRVAIDEAGYVLSGEDVELRLVPADSAGDQEPQPPLRGTRWVLTGIEETEDETVSMTSVGRVRAHLEIEEDSLGFDTGCNSGGGQVRVDADTLLLGEVVTTLRACTGERDRVEREVMAVLGEKRVTWTISSGQLRLTAGAATLLYDAAE